MVMAVVLAAAILVSNIVQFSGFVDAALSSELQKMSSAVHGDIEILKLKAHISALYFLNDRTLVKAMESGDNAAIRNRSLQLSSETGVGLVVVTDTEGLVLAQTPRTSDSVVSYISSMHSLQSALSGIQYTTTEYNELVDMAACSGAPVYDEQGRLLGAVVVGFRLDIDEFVDRQKRVINSEVSIFRRDLCVATTLLNDDGTRAVGLIAPDAVVQAVMAGHTSSAQARISGREMLSVYTPVKDASGDVIGMLFVGHHLSEKTDLVWNFVVAGILITLFLLGICVPFIFIVVRQISSPIDKMLDKVNYDALTGIYNRRYFDERLKYIMQSLSRSESPLSLMMIDIDLFKKYNDTYGHNEGDSCLRIIARTISQSVTRTGDFVARYGGEEFSVVLPNTNEEGACIIADKILESIRSCNIPHKASEVAECVTVSIGITTGAVNFSQSAEDYIKRADEMLYKSKQNGRNRAAFEYLNKEQ